MCGRYTLAVTSEHLKEAFPDLIFPENIAPRFNVAPSQNIPVVLNDGEKKVEFVRWGLIPHWADNPKKFTRTINARSETAAELRSYQLPFRKRRCLILADGFYFWINLIDRYGFSKNSPFRVIFRSGEPFVMAGLWDVWRSPEGEEIKSATILTTYADEVFAQVHPELRMPVILPQEGYEAWVGPQQRTPQELAPLLKPHPGAEMCFYPVSDLVNDGMIDDPRMIQPLPEEEFLQ